MSTLLTPIISGKAASSLSPKIAQKINLSLIKKRFSKESQDDIFNAIREDKDFILQATFDPYTIFLSFLGLTITIGILAIGILILIFPFFDKTEGKLLTKIFAYILSFISGTTVIFVFSRILFHFIQAVRTKIIFNKKGFTVTNFPNKKHYKYTDIVSFRRDSVNYDAFFLRLKDGNKIIIMPFLQKNFVLFLGYVAAINKQLKPTIKSFLSIHTDNETKDFWGRVISLVRKRVH